MPTFHLDITSPDLNDVWQDVLAQAGHVCFDVADKADFQLADIKGQIHITHLEDQLSLSLDYTQARYTQSATSQQLRKALGLVQSGHVLDLTMGLGKDAFQLAMQGLTLTAIEMNPLWVALVKQELSRISTINRGLKKATERLEIHDANSLSWLTDPQHQTLLKQIDAIYFDPMYEAHDTKAQVKKEAQFLRLLSPSSSMEDNQALMKAALNSPAPRVVVKRHPQAAPLIESPAPHHQITGKLVRYDVYVK